MGLFNKPSGRRRGFTLIELLVVVAIIGILASIIMISVGRARAKSRDAKRKSDLATIQTAAEMLNDDTGSYAVSGTGSNGTNGLGWFNVKYGAASKSIAQGFIDAGYFATEPKDPKWAPSCGAVCNGGYMYETTATGYFIYASLESPKDADDDGWDDGGVGSSVVSSSSYGPGWHTNYRVNYAIKGGS